MLKIAYVRAMVVVIGMFVMKEFFEKRFVRVVGGGIAVVGVLWLVWHFAILGSSAENNVYRVARDPTWYPLDLGGRDVNMTAFTSELMREIARMKEIRIEIIDVESAFLGDALEEDTVDAILATTASEMPYGDKYLLFEPIYLVGPVVVMRYGENIESLNREEGKIVAVTRGSTTVIEDPRHYPQLQIKLYNTIRLALNDLVSDKIDAVIMEAIPAHAQAEGPFKGKIKVVTDPLSDEGVRLVALRTPREEHFMQLFNVAFEEFVNSGAYHKLLEKWKVVDTMLQSEKLRMIEGKFEYVP